MSLSIIPITERLTEELINTHILYTFEHRLLKLSLLVPFQTVRDFIQEMWWKVIRPRLYTQRFFSQIS